MNAPTPAADETTNGPERRLGVRSLPAWLVGALFFGGWVLFHSWAASTGGTGGT